MWWAIPIPIIMVICVNCNAMHNPHWQKVFFSYSFFVWQNISFTTCLQQLLFEEEEEQERIVCVREYKHNIYQIYKTMNFSLPFHSSVLTMIIAQVFDYHWKETKSLSFKNLIWYAAFYGFEKTKIFEKNRTILSFSLFHLPLNENWFRINVIAN